MAKEFRFERTQFIPRAREDVFAFFSDAANLERITPKSVGFRFLTPGPIHIAKGTLIDYEIRLYGIPVKWRTRIESFDPPASFSDVQLSGPYRRWLHRHEFKEVSGGTEMEDTVTYEMPFGPLGTIAHWLFVRRTLAEIFDHRREVVAELFAKPQS